MCAVQFQKRKQNWINPCWSRGWFLEVVSALLLLTTTTTKKSKWDFSVLSQVVLEDKQGDEANGFNNIWLEKQPILILVYW